MRPLSMAIPVSLLLLLLASQAAAQSRDYPLTEPAQVSTVRVTAPVRGYFVTPGEADEIKGRYAMSNGWQLDVRPASRSIIARIDNQGPMQLIALSADKFVTADGNVTMEFNQGGFGDEMTMSYVPSSRVAAMIVIRSTVAAR
ncbi:hypothetical protein ACI48D_02375 [Massilia sp. LXY-6]|uniref:hypothetical protein n=1 Tax=Massilia sp. LXY-6 TaxID=3379823 RepID=UPI003EE00145